MYWLRWALGIPHRGLWPHHRLERTPNFWGDDRDAGDWGVTGVVTGLSTVTENYIMRNTQFQEWWLHDAAQLLALSEKGWHLYCQWRMARYDPKVEPRWRLKSWRCRSGFSDLKRLGFLAIHIFKPPFLNVFWRFKAEDFSGMACLDSSHLSGSLSRLFGWQAGSGVALLAWAGYPWVHDLCSDMGSWKRGWFTLWQFNLTIEITIL